MQMALATMLVNAFHATLEDREEAFDRIRVDRAVAVVGPLSGARSHALRSPRQGACSDRRRRS